ncbi:MAG TPA: hypothetical protein VGN88_09000 [Phycisphaerae bacterium]|jgi:endoglucanase
MNPRRAEHQHILTTLCNLPTAPFREEHVMAWLVQWAQPHAPYVTISHDKARNVYLEYRGGPKTRSKARGKKSVPLVLEAHMDHPGFIVTRQCRDGKIEADFRGGVKPSHFKDATAQFWLADETPSAVGSPIPPPPAGRWLAAKVLSVKTVPKQRHLKVVLVPKEKCAVPPNTLGMWNLPDARIKNQIFRARVCDDLAGLAAIMCALDQLIADKSPAHLIALCSRAEEVGFAGVLAVCENQWLPKSAPVIGLETSRAFPAAPQGAGPIIRVGDRTGIFSAGLTHFLTQTAGHIADDDSTFKYQRKLMDGGTCNSTAFAAYGYDSAGICLALGNYHNMTAAGGIGAESIHLGDFHGLVRLLTLTAKRIHSYTPGMTAIKKRLSTMYHNEHQKLLFAP